jgi:iron complex transport system substrate-binding protein
MPCGFDLAGAVAQAPALLGRPEVEGLGPIIAVDANAYFSRPGPRVVEGVELLEELLHGTSGSGRAGARILRP